MEFLDEDLRLRLIQLTWRNPAFMAITGYSFNLANTPITYKKNNVRTI